MPRDGTEIFYRTGFFGNVMMAVPFRATSGLEVGQPEQLFASPILAYASEPIGAHPVYDVAEDGRFLIAKRVSPPLEPRPMNVVTNWFQELIERVPIN